MQPSSHHADSWQPEGLLWVQANRGKTFLPFFWESLALQKGRKLSRKKESSWSAALCSLRSEEFPAQGGEGSGAARLFCKRQHRNEGSLRAPEWDVPAECSASTAGAGWKRLEDSAGKGTKGAVQLSPTGRALSQPLASPRVQKWSQTKRADRSKL